MFFVREQIVIWNDQDICRKQHCKIFFTFWITFIFVINTFLAISRFFIEVYRAEQSLSADTQSERGQNLAQSDQTVDLQLRESQRKLYSQCAFACSTQHIVWKK